MTLSTFYLDNSGILVSSTLRSSRIYWQSPPPDVSPTNPKSHTYEVGLLLQTNSYTTICIHIYIYAFIYTLRSTVCVKPQTFLLRKQVAGESMRGSLPGPNGLALIQFRDTTQVLCLNSGLGLGLLRVWGFAFRV